ncbi:MAG: EI24 domain-containing protein [Deltaproteobacteria bacterium]|nr:EI24 domain-containing protein [Deltaproteobacteria bacterium]
MTRRFVDVGDGTLPRRFFRGALAVPAGVGLVFSDAKLVSLSFVPMLVHLALFVSLLWLGFTQIAGRAIEAIAPTATDTGAWASILAVVVSVVVGVAVVVVAVVASVLVGSVVCDPFYDMLSEQTEIVLVGRSVGKPFTLAAVPYELARELGATCLRLLVWGAVAVPLWALAFTPASIVAAPLGMVWTWLFLAYEYLSRSLVRHAVQPKDRFKPLFSHKALCLGFGSLSWVASFVPFMAPFLVVGATRLYLTLAAWDRAPSLLTPEEKIRLRAEKTA